MAITQDISMLNKLLQHIKRLYYSVLWYIHSDKIEELGIGFRGYPIGYTHTWIKSYANNEKHAIEMLMHYHGFDRLIVTGDQELTIIVGYNHAS